MVILVNMTPKSLSGEIEQDSEPTVSVDPANPSVIIGSAFTPDPGGGTAAPLYISKNGGLTWTLSAIVPGGTADITHAYNGSGGEFYVGSLRGDNVHLNIDRGKDPTTAGALGVLEDRDNDDQPFTRAATVSSGPDAGKDRLYVGSNDFNASGGKTATIDVALDAAIAAPAFNSVRIESRVTAGQDGPQVRPAVHADGTVYAAFYAWRASAATITADVVVVRDDHWGAGAAPFTALVDPGDRQSGVRVARGITIVWSEYLGQQRQAGNLALAVDPNNSATVYLAWCEGQVVHGTYTMHVRRSTNHGVAWSNDLLTVPMATNAGLAINDRGTVALMYQQVTGTGGAQRWETHVRRSTDGGGTWDDLVLATTPESAPVKAFDPYLGDYASLIARGPDFCGIFCANNTPDHANFPNGVTYQRNADFAAHQLLALDGVTHVPASIDPFFFRITAREATRFVAAATNQGGDLHLLVLDEQDGLWHTIRQAAGTWPFPWGDVQGQIRAHGHPDVGPTRLVAAATNQAGDLHVLVLDEHDGLWHTIRMADGSWPDAWGDVQGQIRAHGHPDVGPTRLVAAATNQAGDLHVLVLDEHDGLWHTIRMADGSWPDAWGDVQGAIRAHGHPDVGPTRFVSAATNQAGDLHVLVLDEHDGLWHTIRHADGSWPFAWGDVQSAVPS
jgi:hypothetical protein